MRYRTHRLLLATALAVSATFVDTGTTTRSGAFTAGKALAATATDLQVNVVGADFAVGRNRFTFLLTKNLKTLATAHPSVYFFSLHGFNALPAGQGTARFEAVGPRTSNGVVGVYVLYTTFDAAGKWGAEVDVTENGKRQPLQAIFNVAKRSRTPPIGTAAPRSNNPTTRRQSISSLDSGHPPDALHTVNIAASLRAHHPLVVLFASAAYCGAFQCGSEIAAIQGLAHRYSHSADFVHIDVFKNARPPTLSPTAVQWHIPSQPWVFVVNRSGRILAKFEGLTSASELQRSIRAAISSRPG